MHNLFRSTRPAVRRGAAGFAVLALAVTMTACGGDDALDNGSDGDGSSTTPSTEPSGGSGGASGSITVGGANFTEMLIMENIYKSALEDAGFDVEILSVDNREQYLSALESGEIDVVPDYAATMAEAFNVDKNGADAAAVASSDVDATVEALKTFAEPAGLAVLDPAAAADQNAFAVSKSYAEQYSLTTLSDLGASGQSVILAAAQECPERPFCQPGLEQTYGITISKVLPLGFGSLQTKQAVQNGDAQLGLVGTTDGSLSSFDLVALEDDKKLQLADNLIPVVNQATLDEHPEIADVLNKVSAALTTEDLAAMNQKVDGERQLPADVATAFLTDKGLIG